MSAVGFEDASHPGIIPRVAVVPKKWERKKDSEIPIGFAEEVDAREMAEPVLERHWWPFEQALNKAAGDTTWQLSATMPTWKVDGRQFRITRYYAPVKVAFDFAETEADEKDAEARRECLNRHGIVHVFFPRGAEMNVKAMKTEIERQRSEVH